MLTCCRAFLPVTDGFLVQDLPSRQLLEKKVNGLHALVGNNANEGPGDSGPTALNQASLGTGQQQRADTIYAETTFVCPSYWQAEAYNDPAHGKYAYKYQYSVPPALHGEDVAAYFLPPAANVGPDISAAFKTIWGNFITMDNPSIPATVANSANATVSTNAISTWPEFSVYQPYQIDLNQTGGTAFQLPVNPMVNVSIDRSSPRACKGKTLTQRTGYGIRRAWPAE